MLNPSRELKVAVYHNPSERGVRVSTHISAADLTPKKCKRRCERSAIIIKDDEVREETGSTAGVDDGALTILFAVIKVWRG